jgi:hypothetical protein
MGGTRKANGRSNDVCIEGGGGLLVIELDGPA